MTDSTQKPSHLALYEHELCGFCQMVRRSTANLGLEVESRNILREPRRRQELIEGGGKGMVPCLRIEYPDSRVEWLYESADIIDYLKRVAGD